MENTEGGERKSPKSFLECSFAPALVLKLLHPSPLCFLGCFPPSVSVHLSPLP